MHERSKVIKAIFKVLLFILIVLGLIYLFIAEIKV